MQMILSGAVRVLQKEVLYIAWDWSIANAIDYRGLLAELVSSSAVEHAIGPGICGPCPWEF